MDLVDIDSVLDSLEQREAADASNQHQQQRLRHAPVTSSSSSLTSNGLTRSAAGNPARGNGVTADIGIASKSFVGVSHVFNSLDDYEKNVESLEAVTARHRYDEECRPIGGTANLYMSHANAPEMTVSSGPIPYGPVDINDDDDDDDDDDDVNDDASNNNSKKKSKNKTRYMENISTEADGAISDSSSTSSTASNTSRNSNTNSIFTTSQSGGIATTTEEISGAGLGVNKKVVGIGATEKEKEHKEEENDEDDDDEERCGLLAATVQLDDHNSPILENDIDEEEMPVEEEEDAAEDLATGMSSLSQVVIQSEEINTDVSSALRNVLNDLTETKTTSSLISQVRDEANDKNTVNPNNEVSVLAEEEQNIEREHDTTEEKSKSSDLSKDLGPTTPPLEPQGKPEQKLQFQRYHKPITFGSTMDEISDTELDSMLQEMDIDEEAGGDSIERPLEVVTISETPTSSGTEEVEIVVQLATDTVVEKSIKRGLDEDELASQSACGATADNGNGDNFSQASTVEFSELKIAGAVPAHISTTDNGEEELHETTSANSLDSTYSSNSEQSLENGVMHADAGVEDVHEDSTAPADDGEEDSAMGASSTIVPRPQRPTTLALPNPKSRQLANAGQTPSETNDPNGMADDSNTNDGQEDGAALPEGPLPMYNETQSSYDPHENLGKVPPVWVPDSMATVCMQCQMKFTMIKRRHHCRACGKVLCSVCCSQKFKLEFQEGQPEARVCVECFLILTQREQIHQGSGQEVLANEVEEAAGGSAIGDGTAIASANQQRSPNPNNPMEYCSTIPPHRQVNTTPGAPPPSVIVPVGVLKKDCGGGGSHSSNSSNSGSGMGTIARKRKSVMFSDGIAPGSDLADMENQWTETRHPRRTHQQHGTDKLRGGGSGGGQQKPPTPAKAIPGSGGNSNSDLTTMGLMASLFRGSIPPIAAAATLSTVQGSSSSGGGAKAKIRDVSDAGSASSATCSSRRKSPGTESPMDNKSEGTARREKRLPPSGCDEHGCFIPTGENLLPPIYVRKDETGCDYDYKTVVNNEALMERLQRETLKFALQRNLFVTVKIVNLKCCVHRTVINFTTSGMHHVGNDELIILLEYEPPSTDATQMESINADSSSLGHLLPKDIFVHLYEIYRDAESGQPIGELSYSSPRQSSFLGSREYGGFIFIRATYQCLQEVIVPESPFLIGILIHRAEVPWAKVFPLRLMLRLGAQYRYYPCPHTSMRNRQSVYAEIAQTIINFLADFRNYSYTLPCIHGMYIHMEGRQTTVLVPRNRLAEISKAIDNSSDHILAFSGNFSKEADGHLVCMQNVNDDQSEMYAYSTQAINIQGQPRKVTGASFIVLNEALKTTSGLSGKCSVVEDGLMVQILPSKMDEVRTALRNQQDINIVCGPLNAEEPQTEMVTIKWIDSDNSMNVGVKSPIDDLSMEGVTSIRMHATYNYANANYAIRLTDIYILKLDAWYESSSSTESNVAADVTRIAEQLARSVSVALVPFLDLLAASGNNKLALRATLHQDNVCYEAGAKGSKLPPLYMNALDNQLIPTLHNESSGIEGEPIILELIFYILNV